MQKRHWHNNEKDITNPKLYFKVHICKNKYFGGTEKHLLRNSQTGADVMIAKIIDHIFLSDTQD